MRPVILSDVLPGDFFGSADRPDHQIICLRKLTDSAILLFSKNINRTGLFTELQKSSNKAILDLLSFVPQANEVTIFDIEMKKQIEVSEIGQLTSILSSKNFEEKMGLRSAQRRTYANSQLFFNDSLKPLLQFAHKIEILDGYLLDEVGKRYLENENPWLLEKLLTEFSGKIELHTCVPKEDRIKSLTSARVQENAISWLKSVSNKARSSNGNVVLKTYENRNKFGGSFPHDRQIRFLYKSVTQETQAWAISLGKGLSTFSSIQSSEVPLVVEISNKDAKNRMKQLSALRNIETLVIDLEL